MSAVPSEPPELILEAKRGWRSLELGELWRYRELLWILALRDIQVRYKQTAIGAGWAILQPLLTMAVFVIFFGRLGNLAATAPPGIPYHLFVLAALLPWQLFTYALSSSAMSIVNGRALITRVYFPRLAVPASPLLCGLVDFGISFALLLFLMLVQGVPTGPRILLAPVFVLLGMLAATAVGVWLAALCAVYRDIKHIVPFLTQFWLLATPVAYPVSKVPAAWQWLYGLNPMVGVVDGFRWSVFPTADPPGIALLSTVFSTSILLVGGLFFFRRMERTFADMV